MAERYFESHSKPGKLIKNVYLTQSFWCPSCRHEVDIWADDDEKKYELGIRQRFLDVSCGHCGRKFLMQYVVDIKIKIHEIANTVIVEGEG